MNSITRRDFFAANAPELPADWFQPQLRPLPELPAEDAPEELRERIIRERLALAQQNKMLSDIQWQWAWADAMLKHEPRRPEATTAEIGMLPVAARRLVE